VDEHPWIYSRAVTREIAVLRRITWGNKEAQEALDTLCDNVSALRKATNNAIHNECFGTRFDLDQAQDAINLCITQS